MPQIKFTAFREYADYLPVKPVPASKCIPDWYKETPTLIEGETETGLRGIFPTSATTNTYKACSPFSDSLLSGYIWQAPVDFDFTKTDDGSVICRWRIPEDIVSDHAPEQFPNFPMSPHSTNQIFKWEFPFAIETPKGYSTLFTHPLNRHDLPFRTLSGVVDTDKFPMSVFFPFELLEFNSNKIFVEKGTPLAQFIPFKRESWSHSLEGYGKKEAAKRTHSWAGVIKRSYKKQFWTPKSFR